MANHPQLPRQAAAIRQRNRQRFAVLNGALLLMAIAANYRNLKMLALTLFVGASVFVPVPDHDYYLFYQFCMMSEICVALLAFMLRTNASTSIIMLCVIMVAIHAIGMKMDGYPPFSPYRLFMPLLEHAQLVACLLLSNPLIRKLRNHEPPTI